MRMRRALGILLLAAAGALAIAPSSADATVLTKVGWWWRVNDGTVPATVPSPPTVPAGGLFVAGAPDGAVAVAALHFEVDEGQSAPVLTLEVAENGDQGGETALLAACLSGSSWEPVENGLWQYKPFAACAEGSVTGVRSAEDGSWTFALAPLLSDGIVDVVLVPGVDPALPAGANGSTFQLAFAPPSAASLTTTSGTAGPPLSLPDFGAPAPDPSGGAIDAPDLGAGLDLPPVPAAGFTPSLPDADQGLTATAPLVQQRNTPLPVVPPEDETALGVVLLALSGAALLWSAQQPLPAPRRLGTFGAAHATPVTAAPPAPDPGVGGLGRFARQREGTAPRL